jgi:hypothetical protein
MKSISLAIALATSTALTGDALDWKEMSAKAPGVLIAPVSGEWKAGPYAAFIRFPKGSQSSLHTHSSEMTVVVISGTFRYGANAKEARPYGPGSYLRIAAGAPHVNEQPDGCLLFVEQPGKFDNQPAN